MGLTIVLQRPGLEGQEPIIQYRMDMKDFRQVRVTGISHMIFMVVVAFAGGCVVLISTDI